MERGEEHLEALPLASHGSSVLGLPVHAFSPLCLKPTPFPPPSFSYRAYRTKVVSPRGRGESHHTKEFGLDVEGLGRLLFLVLF